MRGHVLGVAGFGSVLRLNIRAGLQSRIGA